jgi:hypothetical protein
MTKKKDPKLADHLAAYKWKPGESGNKAGRPPDEFVLVRQHRKMLAEPAPKHIVQKLAADLYAKDKKAAPAFVKQGCTWCLAITIRNLLGSGTQKSATKGKHCAISPPTNCAN